MRKKENQRRIKKPARYQSKVNITIETIPEFRLRTKLASYHKMLRDVFYTNYGLSNFHHKCCVKRILPEGFGIQYSFQAYYIR